jgi:hypothetical protein
MNYRVVETDNYGGDYPDEKWALPYCMAEDVAKDIAKILNDHMAHNRYWKVVTKDYTLQPAFEH